MSVAIYAWASRQEAGSPLKKLILLTLADWADQDGVVLGPSIGLSDFCECEIADVVSALDELRGAGMIRWDGFRAILPAPNWGAPKIGGQRHRIYERDGWKCTYCGATEGLTLDHIVPRSRGGSRRDENLTTACRSCNASKGARTPEEWRHA